MFNHFFYKFYINGNYNKAIDVIIFHLIHISNSLTLLDLKTCLRKQTPVRKANMSYQNIFLNFN